MGNKKILVFTGGILTQLRKYVDAFESDPLLSSRFDWDDPEAIIRMQLDFLENGAQVLITNTYQASVDGFMEHMKVSREEAIELLRKSVRVSKSARDRFLQNRKPEELEPPYPLLLGLIGPYGAYLHDASEYNGSYKDKVTKKQLQDWHRSRIDVLLSEGVDALTIATIPCKIEAEALVDMLLNDYPGVKFYFSFQCRDDKSLASGESFADAVLLVWNKFKAKSATNRCIGIGMNCVNPRNITGLLKSIPEAQRKEIPLGVCSNSDQFYNPTTCRWEDNEGRRPVEAFTQEWIDLGIKVLGGCCGVVAEDIGEIRKIVNNANARN